MSSRQPHAERAVLRLAAGGEGGAGGGRVSDAVGGRVGGDEGCVREGSKAKRLNADATFQGGEIGLGEVHLIHAHAVADEVEHIFRLSPCPKGEGAKAKNENGENAFHVFVCW